MQHHEGPSTLTVCECMCMLGGEEIIRGSYCVGSSPGYFFLEIPPSGLGAAEQCTSMLHKMQRGEQWSLLVIVETIAIDFNPSPLPWSWKVIPGLWALMQFAQCSNHADRPLTKVHQHQDHMERSEKKAIR